MASRLEKLQGWVRLNIWYLVTVVVIVVAAVVGSIIHERVSDLPPVGPDYVYVPNYDNTLWGYGQ